jgi:hypothetical protein
MDLERGKTQAKDIRHTFVYMFTIWNCWGPYQITFVLLKGRGGGGSRLLDKAGDLLCRMKELYWRFNEKGGGGYLHLGGGQGCVQEGTLERGGVVWYRAC